MFTFSCDELGTLCSSKEGLKWLQTQMLCDPNLFQEAIHAICSMLTRGKDLCSSNKRIKLRALKVLFAKLSGYLTDSNFNIRNEVFNGSSSSGHGSTSPMNSSILSSSSAGSTITGSVLTKPELVAIGIISPKSSLYGAPPASSPLHPGHHDPQIQCPIITFSKSLALQSTRWANIPKDEILSVAALLDGGPAATGTGSISWDEFLAFSQRLDALIGQLAGETMTNEAFAMLYEEMVRERVACARSEIESSMPAATAHALLDPSLAQRIQACATAARAKQLSPLASLVAILSTGIPSARLDTVLALFRAVGAQITGDNQAPAIRDYAEQCAAVDLDGYKHSRSLDLSMSNMSVSSSFDGSPSPRTPIAHSPQPLVQSASSASNNLIQKDTAGPIGGSSDDVQASMEELRQNASTLAAKLASQGDSLDDTMSIWTALQNLESELSKAQATSSQSSPSTTQGSKPAMNIDMALSDAASRGKIKTGKPAMNIDMALSDAASRGKIKTGRSRKHDPATFSGEPQKKPTNGTFAAPLRNPSPSPGKHSMTLGRSSIERSSIVGGSVVDLSVSICSIASPQKSKISRSPSLSVGGMNRFGSKILSIYTTPDSAHSMSSIMGTASPPSKISAPAMHQLKSTQLVTPILAQRAKERKLSRDGNPSTQLPFQTKPIRPQPKVPTVPDSKKATAPTTATPQYATNTARSKPPPSRANMSIFRSPGRRQTSKNVNVYDTATLQWTPTLVSGKYNKRFQTTHDIMDARKIFSVFYQEPQPVSQSRPTQLPDQLG